MILATAVSVEILCRKTDRQTDTAENHTHATTVGMGNELYQTVTLSSEYQSINQNRFNYVISHEISRGLCNEKL